MISIQEVENDSAISKLVQWFEEEKMNLRNKSRTAALRFSYIEYIAIVQDLIRAERTNNCPLHILATHSSIYMQPQDYAKSCRQYLQSALALEYDFPEIYKQLMLGNHNV